MMNLIVANVFVAAMLAVLAVYSAVRWRILGSDDRLKQRLAALSRAEAAGEPEAPDILRTDLLSRIPWLDRLLRKIDLARDLQYLIEQSGVSVTVAQLMLIMLILGELALVVSLRMGNPFIGVVGFLFFGSLPLLYVLQKRARRMKRFSEQFPDAIDMMVSALRAGHALGRAMQLVAMEAPEPIKTEFRKAFEEQNLGLPMKEALLNLADRVNNVDLRLFVTAVVIQRESGGNLTEILTKIGRTIRARFALLGQIQVYTAQARFTAWVLGILPVAVGLIIYAITPDYIKFFFVDPVGRVMLGFGVFLEILGFLTIRRIVGMKV
jgi:tight adherence protein B